MNTMLMSAPRHLVAVLTLASCLAGLPRVAAAQDEALVSAYDDTTRSGAGVTAIPDSERVDYANTIAGEFTPAKGYDIIKSKRGSLSISVYGFFRYVN